MVKTALQGEGAGGVDLETRRGCAGNEGGGVYTCMTNARFMLLLAVSAAAASGEEDDAAAAAAGDDGCF